MGLDDLLMLISTKDLENHPWQSIAILSHYIKSPSQTVCEAPGFQFTDCGWEQKARKLEEQVEYI